MVGEGGKRREWREISDSSAERRRISIWFNPVGEAKFREESPPLRGCYFFLPLTIFTVSAVSPLAWIST
jgi:hypothetical protein